MKHKYLAAMLFLAFTAPALADEAAPDGTAPDNDGPRAERMLKHLDTNGDGVITPDEFKFPGDRIIKEADLNGDGAVTLDEMHQHHQQMEAKRQAERQKMMADQQAKMDQMFKSMDTNGDGKVTVEEANAAAFKRMDKNGDGVLTADELQPPRWMHKRHHMRPDGGFPPPPVDD